MQVSPPRKAINASYYQSIFWVLKSFNQFIKWLPIVFNSYGLPNSLNRWSQQRLFGIVPEQPGRHFVHIIRRQTLQNVIIKLPPRCYQVGRFRLSKNLTGIISPSAIELPSQFKKEIVRSEERFSRN